MTIAAAINKTAYSSKSMSQSQTGSYEIKKTPTKNMIFDQINDQHKYGADKSSKINESAIK